MKKSLVLVWLVFLVAMTLTSCGPKKVTIDMELKDYSFIPSTVEVPAGAEVTLNLKNTGTLDHEWVIMAYGKQATVPFDADDEPNVLWETEMKKGESGTATFTAPTLKGEYEIVCGTPAHIEQGMLGKLIVK